MPEDAKKEEVDEKGVPLENRMKEMERKLQDKYDKELADTRRELEELKASKMPEEKPDTQSQTQAKLMEFVKDPDAYVRAKAEELLIQRELGGVRSWVQSQPGYSSDDDARLMSIETEYQLAHSSPIERVRAAWKILQNEKLAQKNGKSNDDQRRETNISKTAPEGVGKATDKINAPTRSDLIKKLAAASAKGDLDAEIRLTEMLEDVR